MSRRSNALVILLALLAFVSTVFAASPTSFCKCTCFSNSTIIQLNNLPSTSKPDSSSSGSSFAAFFQRRQKTKERTCNDCNRQFCVNYNLGICKDAKEADVFTQCFQRDSTKDQAVVLIFIVATVGLLLYAGIKPYIERWTEVRSAIQGLQR
ncbi:hypothetical protein K490DRAFT_66514 [Saccharata proteae CBS 121410]|uniref:Uncharacterized protein n=1 Tax=Saccharata proteae CBS 121410 TaxID=1314787 RepID=A0A9P4LY42_9PEZI|nr:hypothetical protein K490DRAFT_66514 [Saccharata proteae CBS 121410]